MKTKINLIEKETQREKHIQAWLFSIHTLKKCTWNENKCNYYNIKNSSGNELILLIMYSQLAYIYDCDDSKIIQCTFICTK